MTCVTPRKVHRIAVLTQSAVTIVNHVYVDVRTGADHVWREMCADLLEARNLREVATVGPLDDPSAILGGYRVRKENEGVLDEQVVRVTELDAKARRLSLYVHYLSAPHGGMEVFATYQAREMSGSTSYAIDCHSRVGVDPDAALDLEAHAAELTSTYATALLAGLAAFKAKVEADALRGSAS